MNTKSEHLDPALNENEPITGIDGITYRKKIREG
jgi:hypothetical protein